MLRRRELSLWSLGSLLQYRLKRWVIVASLRRTATSHSRQPCAALLADAAS